MTATYCIGNSIYAKRKNAIPLKWNGIFKYKFIYYQPFFTNTDS
jgi:hypothetical protein